MRERILAPLRAVEAERALRQREPSLEAGVVALKSYQQRRFARTYADLLASPRYGAAAQFFLDELYGPGDFSRRDAQFSRVVPGLVRLFPHDVVHTVATLAELHATTERLDTAMARHGAGAPWAAASYVRAWQATGQPEQRAAQVTLALAVASQLDVFTRKPLLRQSLRLMRKPAELAGLAELQRFLENGFDTFAAMRGAQGFIGEIEARERALGRGTVRRRPRPGAGRPARRPCRHDARQRTRRIDPGAPALAGAAAGDGRLDRLFGQGHHRQARVPA